MNYYTFKSDLSVVKFFTSKFSAVMSKLRPTSCRFKNSLCETCPALSILFYFFADSAAMLAFTQFCFLHKVGQS